MTRRFCPGSYALVQVLTRAVAWMTGVTTLVILAFIINQWSDKAGAVAAGLVGVSLQAGDGVTMAIASSLQNCSTAIANSCLRLLVRHRPPQ